MASIGQFYRCSRCKKKYKTSVKLIKHMEADHKYIFKKEDAYSVQFMTPNADIEEIKNPNIVGEPEDPEDDRSDPDIPEVGEVNEQDKLNDVPVAAAAAVVASKDKRFIESLDARAELLKGKIAPSRRPRVARKPTEDEEKQIQRVTEMNRLMQERDAKLIESARIKAELLAKQAEQMNKLAKEEQERAERALQHAKEQAEHKAKMIREEMELLREKARLEEEYKLKAADNKNSCAICFDKIANCVILPCKHTIICKDCCDKLHVCPLCRGVIRDRMVIYV